MKKKESISKTNRKIKVAVVLGTMNVGGGEVIASKLCSYVDRDKFDLKLFIIGKYQDNQIARILEDGGVEYTCLGLNNSFNFKRYKVFSKALKSFKPDVVHAHLDISYSWIWCILHNKPLLFTLHTDPYRLVDKRVRLVIKAKNLLGKMKMVCCSKATKERARTCYKLKEKRLAQIYNPIECDKYRKKIDENDGKIRFVHVGRFCEVKNHEMLIKAYAKIESKYDNVSLSLAGEGELKEQMQALATELGCKRINFLGNVKDIPSLLEKSDILLLSSHSEGLPTVILEGMAGGLSIISTDVGGARELVTNNGLLVQEGDEQGFVDAMDKLIQNPEIRKQMEINSYENIKAYDKSRIVKQYEDQYTLLKKGRLE